jgi:hypothetical protein
MTTSAFDPAEYKETTRQQWQETADAWHRWGPTLEAWLGEATELMLDLARIEPGSRVLDLAAGAGGQTLAAARRAGSDGPSSRRTSPRGSSSSPSRRRARRAWRTLPRARWTASSSTSPTAPSTR